MSGGGFVLGGLLQGLGAGITNVVQEKRNTALATLKRQQDLQDYQMKRTDSLADDATATQDKMGLLVLAQQYKQQEGETKQKWDERLLELQHRYKVGEIGAQTDSTIRIKGVEYNQAVAMENIKTTLGKSRDAADRQMAKDLEGGKVVGTSPDGYAVIQKSDNSLVTTRTKLQSLSGAGDAGGGGAGAIAAARAGRGGPAVAPVASDQPPPAVAPVNRAPKPSYAPAYQGLANMPPPPDGKVGRTMRGPGGIKAYWTGTSWMPRAS
ncbi:MAG: hypothetical protein H7345_06585 [Rubritepida sp.]|nr:hypothetical protein [Rubritepida sp.]